MKNKETQITTIIGMHAECKGDFSAEGSIRIDGCINGNVNVSDTIIVGASGCINGDVTARKVIVGGEVNGNLDVPDKVELTSTARVMGDITTNGLVIDENAIFQGNINMNQDGTKKARPNGKAIKAVKKSARLAVEEALREVEAADENNSENDTEAAGAYGSLG